MTYFFERYFVLDYDGKMIPANYTEAIIRPCQWEYDTVLKFLNGKLKRKVMMELGAGIAFFIKDISYKIEPTYQPHFNSIEEMLIWLNLNKGVQPDFEEYHINNDFTDYIVKTIDLRTNTIIYDGIDKTIEMIKHKNKSKNIHKLELTK